MGTCPEFRKDGKGYLPIAVNQEHPLAPGSIHPCHDKSISIRVTVKHDLLAANDLKVNKVKVDRVGVTCHVPDLPLLSIAQRRVLCGWTVPGDCAFHRADEPRIHVSRCGRPVDGIAEVICRRFGRSQERLQPAELVGAFE